MFPILGGLYLGWSVGANDASNVFGTAVSSRIITFRRACILCGLAVILGASLQGQRGIHTLSTLTSQNTTTLLIISIAAAFTVTIMTFLKLPVSTSQAVVGAITGIGLAIGQMNWAGFQKIVICWIATPIGAMLATCVIFFLLGLLFEYVPMSILTRDKIIWNGLLIIGTYGAYALGANNVANATGIFSGQFDGVTDRHLAIIGGMAIASGVVTYSKRVMLAVGSGIMKLDGFTALVAVSSMALTVHVFAVIGVPVSTSQAIVGSIIGLSLVRGTQGINVNVLKKIFTGWLLTPVISLVLAAAGFAFFC